MRAADNGPHSCRGNLPPVPTPANRVCPTLQDSHSLAEDMTTPRLDDEVDRGAGLQLELLDRRLDQADDPGQAAGADHDLGLMPVGGDSLDEAGDLVARGEAGNRPLGEQDLVGPD